MSIRITRRPPLRVYIRNSRRSETVREVDLNLPPTENWDKYGTSAHAYSQVVGPPVPIDVDAVHDVIIHTPGICTISLLVPMSAKQHSRRNRGRSVVVDVDSANEAATSAELSSKSSQGSAQPSAQARIRCN
ncbi:hypothetical protein RHGRI_025920 [Rhododendron griersonianum]|uniref:Uncharacterized protein n=1 Tax=Rhododendron griersonianum TaxID=479676 RepID=A0AAV6IR02_9ERIC|nr:hypothetical protein RHGRI_025920 [Rhododendron griersonianum]